MTLWDMIVRGRIEHIDPEAMKAMDLAEIECLAPGAVRITTATNWKNYDRDLGQYEWYVEVLEFEWRIVSARHIGETPENADWDGDPYLYLPEVFSYEYENGEWFPPREGTEFTPGFGSA